MKDRGRWAVSFPIPGRKSPLKVTRYRGEFLHHENVAKKCLSVIQSEWEAHASGLIRFRPEKWTKAGWTDVLEYFESWMRDVIEPKRSPATIKGYWSYYRNWFTPFFEKYPVMLHEVHLDQLTKMLNFIALAPKGKYNVMNCFHSFLDHAYRSRRIPEMPPFPKKADYNLTEPSFKWLPESVQIKVIESIPEVHRPVFWWLKYHYRRPGEACALQWRDWDAINRVWQIRRSVSARTVIEYTKTHAVHFQPCDPEFLLTALRMQQEHAGPLTDYVFRNPRARKEGGRYALESLGVLWRDACKKNGVDVGLYEGLKHSSCSQFINEKGGTETELQALTDHANLSSVRHYARMGINRKLDLMRRGRVSVVADKRKDEK